MADKSSNTKFLTYEGKPLVRCNDIIYYGSLTDEYVIKLQIKDKKPLKNLELATSVSVQLINTDPNLSSRKKIIKTSEKESLYLAMDIAEIWLSRALKNSSN